MFFEFVAESGAFDRNKELRGRGGLDGHARASSRALPAKATRAAAELVVSQ
jgi:hypothetical protein